MSNIGQIWVHLGKISLTLVQMSLNLGQISLELVQMSLDGCYLPVTLPPTFEVTDGVNFFKTFSHTGCLESYW